jgi:outer membrane protein assembly factor BamB
MKSQIHRSRSCLSTVTAIAVLTLTSAMAADWPQFLGPTRNGVYSGPAIADAWPASGPRQVWKKDVGPGFSGPVVADGKVILFHRVGAQEVIEAVQPATGATIWQFGYPTTYRDDFGFDEGPRAVPVVASGVVYTFGAEGQLHAVDVATGKKLWSEDTAAKFGVVKNFFGAGGSPLVEDGRVIANVGGKDAGIVAFEARTGRLLWKATTDGASYSSGVGATIGSERVAIFFTRNGIVVLDPATGTVKVQQAWRSRSASSVNAASPLVVGDLLFISAEYGPGAGVFRIGNGTLTTVWASDEALSTHYATAVQRDGVLYGYHGRQEFGPSLRAVDLQTGKVRWAADQFRAGSITLAGDRLVIVRESGELVMAPATPDAFKPIARAQIMRGTVRAFPALSDGLLFVRNDRELACLDLRSTR